MPSFIVVTALPPGELLTVKPLDVTYRMFWEITLSKNPSGTHPVILPKATLLQALLSAGPAGCMGTLAIEVTIVSLGNGISFLEPEE